MKIAVLGATGWVGSALVTEAKARDHEVIAIVRDPAKLTAKGVSSRAYDLHSNQFHLQIDCDCNVFYFFSGNTT